MCPRSEKNVSTINAIIVRQCETHSVIHLNILTLTVVSPVNVINCDNTSSRPGRVAQSVTCLATDAWNVGHFGHGHFGLGRFGPDISATDVSATENAKGGRFGQIINFGMGCVHA